MVARPSTPGSLEPFSRRFSLASDEDLPPTQPFARLSETSLNGRRAVLPRSAKKTEQTPTKPGNFSAKFPAESPGDDPSPMDSTAAELASLIAKVQSKDAKQADVVRLSKTRNFLSSFDWLHPENSVLLASLFSTIRVPIIFKSPAGCNFVSSILGLHPGLVNRVEIEILSAIDNLPLSALPGLSHGIFRAWKDSDALIKISLTNTLKLMAEHSVIGETIERADRIRLAFTKFAESRKEAEVDALLVESFRNVVFRYFKVANWEVRLKSVLALGSVFPLILQDSTAYEHEKQISSQLRHFTDAMTTDPHPEVRRAAVKAVANVLCDFWEALPAEVTGEWLSKIAAQVVGNGGAPKNRCTALECIAQLIKRNPLSHGIMPKLIKQCASAADDRDANVRLAFAKLLVLAKSLYNFQLDSVVTDGDLTLLFEREWEAASKEVLTSCPYATKSGPFAIASRLSSLLASEIFDASFPKQIEMSEEFCSASFPSFFATMACHPDFKQKFKLAVGIILTVFENAKSKAGGKWERCGTLQVALLYGAAKALESAPKVLKDPKTRDEQSLNSFFTENWDELKAIELCSSPLAEGVLEIFKFVKVNNKKAVWNDIVAAVKKNPMYSKTTLDALSLQLDELGSVWGVATKTIAERLEKFEALISKSIEAKKKLTIPEIETLQSTLPYISHWLEMDSAEDLAVVKPVAERCLSIIAGSIPDASLFIDHGILDSAVKVLVAASLVGPGAALGFQRLMNSAVNLEIAEEKRRNSGQIEDHGTFLATLLELAAVAVRVGKYDGEDIPAVVSKMLSNPLNDSLGTTWDLILKYFRFCLALCIPHKLLLGILRASFDSVTADFPSSDAMAAISMKLVAYFGFDGDCREFLMDRPSKTRFWDALVAAEQEKKARGKKEIIKEDTRMTVTQLEGDDLFTPQSEDGDSRIAIGRGETAEVDWVDPEELI